MHANVRRVVFIALGLVVALAFAGTALALPADDVLKRINALQARIDDGIKTGQIKPVAARDLNFKVDSIRKRLRAVAGTPAMAAEYRELMKRLDIIEVEIPKPKPPVEQTAEAKIESRMEAISASIDQGSVNGTIVSFEARALITELNSIRKDFESLRARRPLTQQEITRINAKLNRLVVRIEKYKLNRTRH